MVTSLKLRNTLLGIETGTMPLQFISTLTPNEQKVLLISAVFMLYLIVILVFAIAYYLLFNSAPSSFVFAANIAEGQRANRLNETQQFQNRLQNVDEVLSLVGEQLQDEADIRIKSEAWNIQTKAGSLSYENVTTAVGQAATVQPTMVRAIAFENLRIGLGFGRGRRCPIRRA
jgi:hypothetical protein